MTADDAAKVTHVDSLDGNSALKPFGVEEPKPRQAAAFFAHHAALTEGMKLMEEGDQIAAAGEARAAWQILSAIMATLINRQILSREEVARVLDGGLLALEQAHHLSANQAANEHARRRMQELLKALAG